MIRVECRPVPAVADRVDPELPAPAARLESDFGHPLRRRHEPPALPGRIAVVREQCRAAAAERAVRVDLDRPDGQEIAASAPTRPGRQKAGSASGWGETVA